MERFNEVVPTKDEVEEQLARIIANPAFKKREKPAALFEHMVKSELAGITLSQKELRRVFFPSPPYASDGDDVRVAIHTLRALLEAYYVLDGKDDPVLISLPKRGSPEALRLGNTDPYPVIISYADQEIRSGLKLASHLLNTPTIDRAYLAMEAFLDIIRKNSNIFDAHLGLVRSACFVAAFRPSLPRDLPVEAIALASQLPRSRPTDWRAHAAFGAALLCAGKFHEAIDPLAKAHTSMPDDADEWLLWIAAMYHITNDLQAAQTLIAKSGLLLPTDLFLSVAFGFHFYLMRNFEAAKKQLLWVITMDKSNWAAHLALTFVYLSTGLPVDALKSYTTMIQLGIGIPMPGLGILAFLRAHDPEAGAKAREAGLDKSLLSGLTFPGVHLAMSVIDVNPDEAIKCLKSALRDRDPLVLLLPHCSIFDPLRSKPAFQEIVDGIRAVIRGS